MQITISLNEIKEYRPCEDGWKKALRGLGKTTADDEQIPVSRFLDTNGLYDTLWVLRCLPDYDHLWRLFAVWCAKQVEHLMDDERSKNALVVAEQFSVGGCGKEELSYVRDAAKAAERAAESAVALVAAGDAASAAWDAESAAALVAAWDAESAAASAASSAVGSADVLVVAGDAAKAAESAAVMAEQKKKLRILLDTAEIEIDGWVYYLTREDE